MKHIHFPVITSSQHPIMIHNVAIARGTIEKYNLPDEVSYKIFRVNPINLKINRNRILPSVQDILDLDHLITMINNYKNNKPLLENIPLFDYHLDLIKKIDHYYDTKIDCDCVVIASFRHFLFINLYLGLLIKKNNPDIEIMFGGQHLILSDNALNLLRYIGVFEYVIRGDFERAFHDYITDKLIPFNNYELYADSDNYVRPIYSYLELKIFQNMLVTSTRSCPHLCSFCPGNAGKFKVLPIDEIVGTFEYYNKFHNIQTNPFMIIFNDNEVNYSTRRIQLLTEKLISINNQIPIFGFFVLRNLDEQIINDLEKAKFRCLYLGIDTFNFDEKTDIMELHNKKVDNFVNLLNLMYNKNTFTNTVSMLFSVPGETREMFEFDFNSMAELVSRFHDKRKLVLNLNTYIHVAGSPMFKNPSQYGITYEYWDEMNCYDPGLNEIITSVPKIYHCDISEKEMIYRSNVIHTFLEKNGYTVLSRKGVDWEDTFEWEGSPE